MIKKEISMKYFVLSSILCFALPMDTNCHGFYVVVIKRWVLIMIHELSSGLVFPRYKGNLKNWG